MRYTCLLVLCSIVVHVVLSKENDEENEFRRPNHEIESPRFQESDFINNNELCPDANTWFVQGRNGSCHCGSDLEGIVQCDSQTNELTVLQCYCLTNNYVKENKGGPVVGNCIFSCANFSTKYHLYRAAPSNCEDMNRKGTLCGRCLDGYALPAYSYNLKCIKCDSEHQNWGLYIIYAFFPLTVFIFIILVFRINVISPRLYLFVVASQIIASPILLRLALTSDQISGYKRIILYITTSVYGIWNLDFFRVDLLPPVCINVIPLHTLALDYLVAIYPMMLMGVAYIMVELYGCGFRPIMILWRPFHRFLARFRHQWGIETSITDAFLTFFVLSNIKLFSVSFDLLVATKLFTPNGEYCWHLYYDPSIKYFSSGHLPYAATAIGVLIVFILFPLSLLLCYQLRMFHKCLRKCQLSGPKLDMYVYSFQQYYKDGSNGTWDCRWFAGFFLTIKITALLIYALSHDEISYVLIICVFIIAAIIALIVEPFNEENDIFNRATSIFLLLAALFFAFMARQDPSAIFAQGLRDHYISGFILGLFPLIYIIGVIVHHFYKKCCYKYFKKAFGTEVLSSLPDRVLHSDKYHNAFSFIPALESVQTTQEN